MTVPGYLRTFRQAVRELEGHEINEGNERRVSQPELNSSTSFNSWPSGTQKPFARVLAALERRCPDYIEQSRWQQCVADAQAFIAAWGEQANALGWTSRDLFGLHTVPTNPHPSYSRLSRYDYTGMIWLLQDQPVIALTGDTAAIKKRTTGNTLIYRKALGRLTARRAAASL